MPEWISEQRCQEILGVEKAQAFLKQFGGNTMYVPKSFYKNHRIAKIVGIIGMAALTHQYGGYYVAVSNSKKKSTKRDRIEELLKYGIPKRKIADLLDVTVRYVSKVANNEDN